MAASKVAVTPLPMFAGTLVALDQLTKYLVVLSIPLNTGIPVFSGLLNLVHVDNTGGAFSIFAGARSPLRQYLFVGLAVAVIAAIAFAYLKAGKKDNWSRIAYILIAGGACGNLVDRVRLGEVIDFIDVYVGRWHWPAFNVADAALSTGAVMLLISLLKKK